MKLRSNGCRLIVVGLFTGLLPNTTTAEWPQFRGPGGAGVSHATNVPTTWDRTTHVLWKVPLPGPGTSSPILLGDRIYLTCYSGYGVDPNAPGDPKDLTRHLVCVNRADGEILWDVTMRAKNPEPGYGGFLALHGYASSTPTADLDGVYVFYGASGVAAYSHDGELNWEANCGTRHYEDWGSASSPVLYQDLVIVHADVESQSLYAFNRMTGDEVWKRTFAANPSNQHTRSTPLIWKRAEGDELIVHSREGWLSALDPANGQTLWEYEGTTNYQNPSPVTDGETVFALTYSKTVAVRAGGDLAWSINRGSEICTPVYHDGHLYWASEEGHAYCVDTESGQVVYAERLVPASGRVYASGVLAEGRIYYVSREKGTYVVAANPEFQQLAHNELGDPSVFNATPALENGRIYLRSDRYLYCIGE